MVSTTCWNSLISISAAGVQIGSVRNNRSRPSVLIQNSVLVRMILDPGADAPRASSAFGTVAFSTDFHHSFEVLPSRKPFPPANLNPTVPTLPPPFESLTSYSGQAFTLLLPCPLIVR